MQLPISKNCKPYRMRLTQKTYLKQNKRACVTQHAVFNYLALDYGLKRFAISGLSPDAEPSAARLAELTVYVKKNKIAYIYFERKCSHKKTLANTLSKAGIVKLMLLNPLESLTKRHQGWRKLHFRDGEKPQGFETNNRPRRPSNQTWQGRGYQDGQNCYFLDAAVCDGFCLEWLCR